MTATLTLTVTAEDCVSRELTDRLADMAMSGQATVTETYIRRYAVSKPEYILACEVAEACGLQVI